MTKTAKIQSIEKITHDVLRIVLDKPAGVVFNPGQAADISINKPGWEGQLRPFTFTSVPDADHLEFTIKTYPERKGVTNELLSLSRGDELLIGEVFGEIAYKGEGLFIAGGAGVTPFIAILRYLYSQNQLGNNKLIFANKTRADIIHEKEFHELLGNNFINVLSGEEVTGYEHGYMTAELIKKYITPGGNAFFYLCGPPPMMDVVEKLLAELKIEEDRIVKEGF